MTTRETVAVDVDEVLFPFIPEFLKYHEPYHQGEWAPENFSSYRFDLSLDIPIEKAIELIFDFTDTDHSHIVPIASAREAIGTLNEAYDLVVITARDPRFMHRTERWFDTHLADFFTDIVHVGHAAVLEGIETKGEVCRRLGAVALIDDSLEHVSDCADKGIEGVLFGDYFWNQADELPAGVVRCPDWPAVLEYFDAR